MEASQRAETYQSTAAPPFPVLICLMGGFRLLKFGHPIPVRGGGKTETLLSNLALRRGRPVQRDTLLSTLWPDVERTLAGQSLHSLVYSLHKQFGDVIGGEAPVVLADGRYQLNVEAGIGIDIASFEALASGGDTRARRGDGAAAVEAYRQAVDLYRGDLSCGADICAVVERERLRARYLTLLGRIASYYYSAHDYVACLDHALLLIDKEPCREDAHRLVMRCYMRRGERAQALRQYRLCEHVLRTEFDATPEPATNALFDQIRLDPDSI